MENARLPPRTRVVSVGMQKGGVGKTTNALHLGAALAERGRRVLLWDVDENYGATKVLGASQDGWTTMEIVSGDCSVTEAVVSSEDPDSGLPPGLDFIPSSRSLQSLERGLGGDKAATNCLAPHIRQLRALGRHDYIVIDTGPHASATTRSAYLVSDHFVLSVTPDKQAIASLPDALRDVMNARRAGRNPELNLLGLVLCCMGRRLRLAKEYERALDTGFVDREGRPVKFKTAISSAAAVNQAYRENELLLAFAPRHRVSQQYRELAGEVEARINAFETGRVGTEPVDAGREAVTHG